MNSTLKSLLFWLVLVVIGALIWQFSAGLQKTEKQVAFTKFMELVKDGQIKSVTISGNEITAKTTSTDTSAEPGYRTFAPPYPDLVKELRDKSVEIDATRESNTSWTMILLKYAPIVLMVGF